jgi:Abnormal spindle-like microcephaly-assoc'd, ASPM-SPD-2-Hydin
MSFWLTMALTWTLGFVSCSGATPSSSTSGSGGGSGNAEARLSTSVSSVSFGNVVIGSPNTQPITLTNSGNASLSISQATISGSGFGMTGIATPITLAAGQNTTVTVKFAPQGGGSVTGTISLVSNAVNSPTVISLSGTGIAATLQLSAGPASLNFGSITVGSSSTQTTTLTNTGNSTLSIGSITVSGTGFSASGSTPPSTLTAGQSATLSVVFSPTSAGSFNGSVSAVSDATNSPTTISLSGTGVQTPSPSVILSWTASTSLVIGYNVYRGTQSGGPYTRLNSSLDATTTYTDPTVQAGQTYYYVVTSVDSDNNESVYSNQTSATIPSS